MDIKINKAPSAQPAPSPKSNLGTIVIVFVIIVVAVVLYLFKDSLFVKKQASTTVTPTPTSTAAVTNNQPQQPRPIVDMAHTPLAENVLPQGFPANLPLEKGASIVANYNGADKAGRMEGTRKFTSQNSLDSNIKIYKDYFEQNGWANVKIGIDGATLKALTAKNSEWDALVVASQNSDGTKVVEITFSKYVASSAK